MGAAQECCVQSWTSRGNSILVQLPSSLFSRRFVRVQVVQPYSSTDITTAWKNCHFNLSVRSDFHMTDNLFVADHAFPIRVLTLLFCTVMKWYYLKPNPKDKIWKKKDKDLLWWRSNFLCVWNISTFFLLLLLFHLVIQK